MSRICSERESLLQGDLVQDSHLHVIERKTLQTFPMLLLLMSSPYLYCRQNQLAFSYSQTLSRTKSAPSGLPDFSFGVEFEFILPTDAPGDEKSRRYADYRKLAEVLQWKGHDASWCEPLDPHKKPPNDFTQWRVVPDDSLKDNGLEVVSPIFSGLDGLREVKNMCETLNELGAACDSSCGLHVHVNSSGLTGQQVATLVLLHDCLEQKHGLLDCLAEDRRDNPYCLPTDSELLKIARQGPISKEDVIAIQPADREYLASIGMTPKQHAALLARSPPSVLESLATVRTNPSSSDKYRALHLFTTHGTVEFRRHEGTTQYQDVLSWIVLCLTMVSSSTRGHSRARWTGSQYSDKNLRDAFMALGLFDRGNLTTWSANYLLALQAASHDTSKEPDLTKIRQSFDDLWLQSALDPEPLQEDRSPE